MRKYLARRWFGIILGLLICTVAMVHSARALPEESVRAELIRSQEEKGLTLAWVDDTVLVKSVWAHTTVSSGVEAIMFKERTIVPLKDSLGVFRPDGFNFRDYPALWGIGACWSRDQSKLADTMIEHSSGRATWKSLTLARNVLVQLRSTLIRRNMSLSNAGPPMANGSFIRWMMPYGSTNSTTIGRTRLRRDQIPTWSPDGNWIAFRDGEAYYAMHPDGSARKKLFHNHWGSAVSALYWSPDSRIVAYVRELGFLQGGALDAEVNQLRVRRLEDGSDDRLCPDNVAWYANYHWITASELKQPGSGSPH